MQVKQRRPSNGIGIERGTSGYATACRRRSGQSVAEAAYSSEEFPPGSHRSGNGTTEWSLIRQVSSQVKVTRQTGTANLKPRSGHGRRSDVLPFCAKARRLDYEPIERAAPSDSRPICGSRKGQAGRPGEPNHPGAVGATQLRISIFPKLKSYVSSHGKCVRYRDLQEGPMKTLPHGAMLHLTGE